MTDPHSSDGLAIRAETPADRAAVREVHVRAFGSDREADLAAALRDAPAPLAPLSYGATVDDRSWATCSSLPAGSTRRTGSSTSSCCRRSASSPSVA